MISNLHLAMLHVAMHNHWQYFAKRTTLLDCSFKTAAINTLNSVRVHWRESCNHFATRQRNEIIMDE
jgi:hypothetical protein